MMAIACPACFAPMVLRDKNRYGAPAMPFWVCPNDQCRTAVPAGTAVERDDP